MKKAFNLYENTLCILLLINIAFLFTEVKLYVA